MRSCALSTSPSDSVGLMRTVRIRIVYIQRAYVQHCRWADPPCLSCGSLRERWPILPPIREREREHSLSVQLVYVSTGLGVHAMRLMRVSPTAGRSRRSSHHRTPVGASPGSTLCTGSQPAPPPSSTAAGLCPPYTILPWHPTQSCH